MLAALEAREVLGVGQMIDVAGAEGLMRFLDFNLTWYHLAGRVKERTGRLEPAAFPYTFAHCKDGMVYLAAYNDEAFRSLAQIMGKPQLAEEPRFATFLARTRRENMLALLAEIEDWSNPLTAEEIIGRIQAHIDKVSGPGAAVVTGKVCAPAETLAEPNWWARGAFEWVQSPHYGKLLLAGPPWKMSATPPRIKWAARPVGADTAAVYARHLDLGPEDITFLREADAV